MKQMLGVAGLVTLLTCVDFAQPSMPACEGDLTIVRVSRIKPGGSLDGFLKAAEAHRAWYRANKITTNEIVTARVIDIDRAAGTSKFSETGVLQFHISPAASTECRRCRMEGVCEAVSGQLGDCE